MDKIYSRNRRIHLPKFNKNNFQNKYKNMNFSFNNNIEKERKRKSLKIFLIIILALVTARFIIYSISPILDKQCINMAKSIATKVCNEQASSSMAKYKYEDLCIIDKDTNRKYKND